MIWEIMRLDWSKRRKHTKEPQPVDVEVPDFRKIHGHMCDAFVTYDDGQTHTLLARCLFNENQNHWAINGVANGGLQVSAKLIE